MKVKFLTLGCKVNQYETEVLSSKFVAAGFELSDDFGDIIVVNSCTVTSTADKKTRQLIRKLRRENPTAILALTGCLPQSSPDIAEILTELDIITGANNRSSLIECVTEHLRTGKTVVNITPHRQDQGFEPMEVSGFEGHRRAFIKIQDGCDRFCSYCIIPTARGPLRSKAVADIKNEAQTLVQKGFKELVLVGINLAMYGVELGLTLADGVDAASSFEGDYRIRLGSIEPDLFTDGTLARLYSNKRLCPHFHLPLQSGCDSTLSRMNRKYTTKDYLNSVSKIRSLWGQNTAISTDIMVGFPGEDEQEFEDTLSFTRSIGLSDAHIFEFSPRKGTVAYSMENQVAPKEKSARSSALTTAVKESAEEFARRQIGSTYKVLVENCGNAGHNEYYTYVLLPEVQGQAGKMLEVLITGSNGIQCVGKVI